MDFASSLREEENSEMENFYTNLQKNRKIRNGVFVFWISSNLGYDRGPYVAIKVGWCYLVDFQATQRIHTTGAT